MQYTVYHSFLKRREVPRPEVRLLLIPSYFTKSVAYGCFQKGLCYAAIGVLLRETLFRYLTDEAVSRVADYLWSRFEERLDLSKFCQYWRHRVEGGFPAYFFLVTKPFGKVTTFLLQESMSSFQEFFDAISAFGQAEGLELNQEYRYRGGFPAELRETRFSNWHIGPSSGFCLISNIFGTSNAKHDSVRGGKEEKFSESVGTLLERAKKSYEELKRNKSLANLIRPNTLSSSFSEVSVIAKMVDSKLPVPGLLQLALIEEVRSGLERHISPWERLDLSPEEIGHYQARYAPLVCPEGERLVMVP